MHQVYLLEKQNYALLLLRNGAEDASFFIKRLRSGEFTLGREEIGTEGSILFGLTMIYKTIGTIWKATSAVTEAT